VPGKGLFQQVRRVTASIQCPLKVIAKLVPVNWMTAVFNNGPGALNDRNDLGWVNWNAVLPLSRSYASHQLFLLLTEVAFDHDIYAAFFSSGRVSDKVAIKWKL
jgi:hypothetical protein